MANRTMKTAIRRELERRKMTLWKLGQVMQERGVVSNNRSVYRALANDDADVVDHMAEYLGLRVTRKLP